MTDDKENSCQSNCDQPKSGASGSNVRKRVVGKWPPFEVILICYYPAFISKHDEANGVL